MNMKLSKEIPTGYHRLTETPLTWKEAVELAGIERKCGFIPQVCGFKNNYFVCIKDEDKDGNEVVVELPKPIQSLLDAQSTLAKQECLPWEVQEQITVGLQKRATIKIASAKLLNGEKAYNLIITVDSTNIVIPCKSGRAAYSILNTIEANII